MRYTRDYDLSKDSKEDLEFRKKTITKYRKLTNPIIWKCFIKTANYYKTDVYLLADRYIGTAYKIAQDEGANWNDLETQARYISDQTEKTYMSILDILKSHVPYKYWTQEVRAQYKIGLLLNSLYFILFIRDEDPKILSELPQEAKRWAPFKDLIQDLIKDLIQEDKLAA